uniref:Uncharacterized protein n=1 Tax=Tetranychus urticae TaxID=32264 RepID=T1JV09_TETUR
MSDERNRIVTLINHEANPIEIFREFETQRIELVCFPFKHCYHDGDLRNYQFHSEHEMVTRIVKSALLMGPYRIISYFANETNDKIHRWVDTGNGSTQYMEMTAVFSGRSNKELTGLKNALKITITAGQDRNVILYITQVEPFERITITKKDGGYIDGLTEVIGPRKIFVSSYKSGKFNKFMVKAEYNKAIDNVNYDLVVTTYSTSPNTSYLGSLFYYSDWFEGLSIEQKLYSKSATNQESFQYDYIESRVISFSDGWHFNDDFNEIAYLHDRCFKERKEGIILNLKISCLDQSTTKKLHNAIGGIFAIKKELRRLLMDKLGISFLRINLIKFSYFHYNIMVKVEISDSIVIDFLKKRGVSHKFKIKSTESGQIYTSTIDECLHLKAVKVNLSDVITCKTRGDYLCLGIGHGDSLPDEDHNGLDCMVFSNSDQRLSRLSAEAPLKVIEKSYLKLYESQFSSLGVKFAVVDVTIQDAPEKAKSNSTSVFFFIYSILITIVIFIKLAFDFRLIQRRNYSLHESFSLKLIKSSI